MPRSNKGFTLIEILIVIGILAVLMAITLIAINPFRQFGQANNTARKNAVKELLDAVWQNAIDNKGVLPATITTSVKTIRSGAGNADLCSILIPTYIPSLPEDPSVNGGQAISNCTSYNTGYTIVKDSGGRVTVAAPSAETGATISITR